MLRDNLVELIEPMHNSAGTDLLALGTYQQKPASDDSLSCLENPRPEGAESSLTDNVTSPFPAEPKQFGIQYLHESEYTHSTQYSNGVFTFNGSRTGLSLADFMLGLVAQDQQGGDVTINDYRPYLGLYAQDAWKIRSRLTINYGVRWEPAFQIASSTDHVMQFSQANFVNNVRSTIYHNSPPGFLYPGDPGYTAGNAMAPTEWAIFSPRFGLIYDPRGKGSEVIRAAYGVFVDSQPLFDNIYVGSNPPWGALTTLNNVQLSNPFANTTNPFPFTLSANSTFPLAGTYHVQLPHMKQEYVQQWNFSIEKQFLRDWLASANYVGNESTHLWSAIDANAPVYNPAPGASTTGNEQARRLLTSLNPTWGPYIGPLIQDNIGGTANYNGLILSVNKGYTHNYSILANYTYSHCINDFDPHQNTNSSNVDPYSLTATRGNCTGDLRHVVNVSIAAGMPKFNSRALETIAGNWQFSGIFHAQTGFWNSILSGRDNAYTGIGGQFADLVGDPHLANPTRQEWFNKAAYVQNAPGTIGDSGRNTVLGPGYWNLNVALIRNFPIKEAMAFQFRAEAYNVLNHTELVLNDSSTTCLTLTSATFGQIVAAQDPRIMQFAAKFIF